MPEFVEQVFNFKWNLSELNRSVLAPLLFTLHNSATPTLPEEFLPEYLQLLL